MARKSSIGRSGGSDTIIFSLWLIEIEKFMNSLRKIGGVSQFSALLLVSLYPYHVRELLVRWLLFTAGFAALAHLVLTGALACYVRKRHPPGARDSASHAGGGARSRRTLSKNSSR
jgi:hypothetical protein